ncbi:MAG: KEOPS complex kinase/ATPase Bud32 [Candidatus Nanohaloarchaea archaeon]
MTETIEGAEAKLEFRDDSVVKKRHSKNYRHPDLDEKIREERTEREARLMREARKNGVNVPGVEKTGDDTLEIEEIDGEQLKDALDRNSDAMEQLGENAARLHEADMIHGDLTTRNAMLSESGTVLLIDFGLASRSSRTEDKAVDIHLLKQVLESSHPGIAEEAWQKFLEGYRGYGDSEEVMERLKEVEQRGRYK